jgi:hypothetical protein
LIWKPLAWQTIKVYGGMQFDSRVPSGLLYVVAMLVMVKSSGSSYRDGITTDTNPNLWPRLAPAMGWRISKNRSTDDAKKTRRI